MKNAKQGVYFPNKPINPVQTIILTKPSSKLISDISVPNSHSHVPNQTIMRSITSNGGRNRIGIDESLYQRRDICMCVQRQPRTQCQTSLKFSATSPGKSQNTITITDKGNILKCLFDTGSTVNMWLMQQ